MTAAECGGPNTLVLPFTLSLLVHTILIIRSEEGSLHPCQAALIGTIWDFEIQGMKINLAEGKVCSCSQSSSFSISPYHACPFKLYFTFTLSLKPRSASRSQH